MSLHLPGLHSQRHPWLLSCLLLIAAAGLGAQEEGSAPVEQGSETGTRIDTLLPLLTPEGHRISGALVTVSLTDGTAVASVRSDQGSPARPSGEEHLMAQATVDLAPSALCQLSISGGDIVMADGERRLRLGNDTLYENVVPCRILDRNELPDDSRERAIAVNEITSTVLDTIRLYVPLDAPELDLDRLLNTVARRLLGPEAVDLDRDGVLGYADFSLSGTGTLRALSIDRVSDVVRAAVEDALDLAAPTGPNVVMIVADDLGFGDVTATWQNAIIATPNLDRIAARGARFSNFHVQPVCASTRASLLTGYYHRELAIAGAGGPARAGIPRWARTMPETLRGAGYATAAFGKWHLSYRRGFLPPDRGFQEWLGFYGGSSPYSLEEINRRSERFLFDGQQPFKPKPGHTTDLFADRALAFIERQSGDRPFFLYLAFNAPHTPIWRPENPVFSARPDWLQRVRAQGVEHSSSLDYMALVSHMDERIGHILDLLETKKLDRDTLVIFLSDNGADLEAGGSFPGPGSNGAFRGGKGSVFEGGTRVPLLMQWPALIEPGTEVDSFTMMIDLWPTVRELIGVHPSHGQALKPLSGKSLVPLLSGGTPHVGTEGREGWFLFPLTGLALRQPPWKLIRHADGSEELYNLRDDPVEATPANKHQADRVQSMSRRIDQYLGISERP